MSNDPRGRWGVELHGDRTDLEDWEEDLNPPFDPSVVTLPDKDTPGAVVRVLQSVSFESCTTASQVRGIALPLVRTLSGLIGVRRGAMPVGFGGLIEFRSDGTWNRYTLVEAAQVIRPPKSRATGIVGGEGSSYVPAPPAPSYAQSMAPNLSDDLQAALRYFDMADNWYDLYKAYEAVLSHLNPRNEARAKKKLKKLGFTHAELKGLDSSPRHYRHHKTTAPLVFTFHEAKELTRRILDAILQSNRDDPSQ